MAKDSSLHQDQVISPLTQSAQRFPFYVRDSIMTPRCRKPVFTFSPIDEPADDLVPNSDTLQLANMNLPHPPPSVQENKAVEEPECSASDKDVSTVENSDTSLAEDSENSILSGCAPIQENRGTLTSPFKQYLIKRDIHVFDESVEVDDEEENEADENEEVEEPSASEVSLLESDQPISESLLEFLDGNQQDPDSYPHSSPTRPSPSLTKSILFETSL